MDGNGVDATAAEPFGDGGSDVLIEEESEAHAAALSATRASISSG
jgi:hypothetical protein